MPEKVLIFCGSSSDEPHYKKLQSELDKCLPLICGLVLAPVGVTESDCSCCLPRLTHAPLPAHILPQAGHSQPGSYLLRPQAAWPAGGVPPSHA